MLYLWCDLTCFFKSAIISCMDDTDHEKRSSVFTIRDAENAMMTFTVFVIATVIGVFLHEIVLKRNSITDRLYAVMHNISEILSAATLLTLIDEGIDIMFLRRTREERKKIEKQTMNKHFLRLQNGIIDDLKPKRAGKHLQSRHPEKIP